MSGPDPADTATLEPGSPTRTRTDARLERGSEPTHPLSRHRAWIVTFAVYGAGVAATLNGSKTQPLLPVLMNRFDLDMTTAGSLVSIYSLAAAIMTIPAGYLLLRLGPRLASGLAIGLIGLGAVTGAASGTWPALVVEQAIEGAGLGVIAVIAPAIIATSFPAASRGAPLGVWGTWAPVGAIVMFNVAPALAGRGGWQAVWWLGAGAAFVALVLVAALLPARQAEPDTPRVGHATLGAAIRAPGIWLLGAAFATFCLTSSALSVFYPTFLVARGYDLGTASSITSLSMAAFLVAGPLSGVISDRIGSRKLVYTVPAIVTAPLWLLPFTSAGWQIPVLLLVLGVCWSACATAMFAAAPDTVESPRQVGMAMAGLMLGQSLGNIVGPLLFGSLVQAAGWQVAGLAMIPITLAGAAAGWRARVR